MGDDGETLDGKVDIVGKTMGTLVVVAVVAVLVEVSWVVGSSPGKMMGAADKDDDPRNFRRDSESEF